MGKRCTSKRGLFYATQLKEWYGYPQHQDVMEVDPADILTLVSPSIATGHRYYLTAKEVAAATCALDTKA